MTWWKCHGITLSQKTDYTYIQYTYMVQLIQCSLYPPTKKDCKKINKIINSSKNLYDSTLGKLGFHFYTCLHFLNVCNKLYYFDNQKKYLRKILKVSLVTI